ncbi:UNVERIFIED_CONTAM: hypothetical protein FKN15_055088 [Acipenser sinensis]
MTVKISLFYAGVASELGVRGYPTIKLLKGDLAYNYRGPRTKDDIIEFANRVAGPVVRSLPSQQMFEHVQKRHNVLFLYVGGESPLKEKYIEVASELIVYTYFFSALEEVLPKHVTLQELPAVLVFKDGTYFVYDGARRLVHTPRCFGARLSVHVSSALDALVLGARCSTLRSSVHAPQRSTLWRSTLGVRNLAWCTHFDARSFDTRRFGARRSAQPIDTRRFGDRGVKDVWVPPLHHLQGKIAGEQPSRRLCSMPGTRARRICLGRQVVLRIVR